MKRYYEEHIRTKQVKLQRAQGECLGTESRRRTQRAAKRCGESQVDAISADIRMEQSVKAIL